MRYALIVGAVLGLLVAALAIALLLTDMAAHAVVPLVGAAVVAICLAAGVGISVSKWAAAHEDNYEPIEHVPPSAELDARPAWLEHGEPGS